jgi:hypothetical protein
MPVVFVLARDWILRTAVRAELREIAIEALGMDSPDDVGRRIAAGQMPAAIILEATGDFVSHSPIQDLVSRVPTIWIASRTERIPLPSPVKAPGAADNRPANRGLLMYRPVRIRDIVSRVQDILRKGQAA